MRGGREAAGRVGRRAGRRQTIKQAIKEAARWLKNKEEFYDVITLVLL